MSTIVQSVSCAAIGRQRQSPVPRQNCGKLSVFRSQDPQTKSTPPADCPARPSIRGRFERGNLRDRWPNLFSRRLPGRPSKSIRAGVHRRECDDASRCARFTSETKSRAYATRVGVGRDTFARTSYTCTACVCGSKGNTRMHVRTYDRTHAFLSLAS